MSDAMTGPDHYREAERLALVAEEILDRGEGVDVPTAEAYTAIAAVHAHLAGVAVAALGGPGMGHAVRDAEQRAWTHTASEAMPGRGGDRR